MNKLMSEAIFRDIKKLTKLSGPCKNSLAPTPSNWDDLAIFMLVDKKHGIINFVKEPLKVWSQSINPDVITTSMDCQIEFIERVANLYRKKSSDEEFYSIVMDLEKTIDVHWSCCTPLMVARWCADFYAYDENAFPGADPNGWGYEGDDPRLAYTDTAANIYACNRVGSKASPARAAIAYYNHVKNGIDPRDEYIDFQKKTKEIKFRYSVALDYMNINGLAGGCLSAAQCFLLNYCDKHGLKYSKLEKEYKRNIFKRYG